MHGTTVDNGRPVLLGPRNCEAFVGANWRWCRDTAHRLGVRFVGAGRKRFIPALEFFAAHEREEGASPRDASADPAGSVRAALGLRRRA